ncbi:ISNCY family transposase [Roseibium aggregatum]|uniref:ISNCY family transposase n=1 Tax=Roseibium aggregatum TaxID=187304 RepID=UPI00058E13FD|nr:ISNCY family transposase [Roseibium aggregatum]
MGWVLMSERDLNRVEILAQVEDGHVGVTTAANLMNMSRRHVYRLLDRFRSEGPGGIRHRARGRRPNNAIHPAKREYAMTMVRERYEDFGPTLAAEMLLEHHGFKVGRETLRQWMIEDGLWLSRKQRRRFHQPRLRRECFGELVQIDGSEHRWFEDRGDPCTLLVFIDDATSTLMELRFVRSESAFSYFEALDSYLTHHGRPVAFYSDKHSVFRVNKSEVKGGQGMTQFGRALSELNIEILCANSSQAKGRVERANRTLQDRLVKALRLADIGTIEDANAFLPTFIERYNAQFSKVPARSDNLHRALNVEPDRLQDILCWKEKRYVTAQLAVSYERKRLILEENEVTSALPGKYVETRQFADGCLEVLWNGVSLPFKVFDKDQRVSHAAITENKRLGDVLSWVKEQQDANLPPPKVKSSSEKGGYKRRGKRRGRPSLFDDPKYIAKRQKKGSKIERRNEETDLV